MNQWMLIYVSIISKTYHCPIFPQVMCSINGSYGNTTFAYILPRKKKGMVYMYDELTAKKECNEVVSFLHHYLTNFLSKKVTTLYLFSDNCFAQNKNQTIVQYTFMNTSNTNIQLILHQFPEPGHSFLPCDRCFGIIEKEKRKKK